MRLEKLGLFSLQQRRLANDMTEIYKNMRGMDRVICAKHFLIAEIDKTREHRFKLMGKRFRRDMRETIFNS